MSRLEETATFLLASHASTALDSDVSSIAVCWRRSIIKVGNELSCRLIRPAAHWFLKNGFVPPAGTRMTTAFYLRIISSCSSVRHWNHVHHAVGDGAFQNH